MVFSRVKNRETVIRHFKMRLDIYKKSGQSDKARELEMTIEKLKRKQKHGKT